MFIYIYIYLFIYVLYSHAQHRQQFFYYTSFSLHPRHQQTDMLSIRYEKTDNIPYAKLGNGFHSIFTNVRNLLKRIKVV
jgi:hypothetical protein